MRGSGSKATGDLQTVLEEIGGRLAQAAQSVEVVGQTVAALAEGLAGADADGLVQAATTRLIGLALGGLAAPGGLWSPAVVTRTKRVQQDGRGVPGIQQEDGQEAEFAAIQGRILEELPMVVAEVGTASSRKGSQLVAVGIEAGGVKRVLAVQPGSGADRKAVGELAADLYRRGLHAANGNPLLLINRRYRGGRCGVSGPLAAEHAGGPLPESRHGAGPRSPER